MKTSSRKAKGRRLQQQVANELKEVWKDASYKNIPFKDKDIQTTIMGMTGKDILISPLYEEVIPWDIECKNQEKWQLEPWWEQTVTNTGKDRKPILIIKKNNTNPIVVMNFEDFLLLNKYIKNQIK